MGRIQAGQPASRAETDADISAGGVRVRERALTDYTPDPQNPNRGSVRGRELLRESLKQRGAGRSLLADADGMVIAGNQTLREAAEAGITRVVEVETDGDALVVVRRRDLDLDSPDDPRARQLSLDDNRATDFREWDVAALEAAERQLGDLAAWFGADELDDLAAAADAEAAVAAAVVGDAPVSRGLTDDRARQVKFVQYVDEVLTVERALRATGIEKRGAALVAVCKAYLEGRAALEDDGRHRADG